MNNKKNRKYKFVCVVSTIILSISSPFFAFSDASIFNTETKRIDINRVGPTISPEESDGSNVIIAADDASDAGFRMFKARVARARRFDEIKFGRYEQDNDLSNGTEPIDWIVLDSNDMGTLLVSKYILDCKKFNNTAANVTWEDSDLRKWLNNDFYNIAFRASEKKFIANNIIQNKKNYYYNTLSGNQTMDYVFPLSIEEAIMYFETADNFYDQQQNALNPNPLRRALGTPYAIQNGLRVAKENLEYKGCGNYWLRTLGKNENREWYSGIFAKFYVAIVQEPGYINPSGTAIHSGDDGVRPAIWLNIN